MTTDTTEMEPIAAPAPDNGPWADDASDWMIKPAKTIRVRPLSYGLVIVLMAVAGLWAGATIEKHHGTTTSAASRATTAAGSTRTTGSGATGSAQTGTGFAGPGGTGSSTGGTATSGSVTAVNGNTITVKTSAGKTIEVTVSSTTVMSRTGEGAVGAITKGDRLTVVGTTHGSNVAATSVTATAANVTQSSNFGPGGSFGGGTGGPPSA